MAPPGLEDPVPRPIVGGLSRDAAGSSAPTGWDPCHRFAPRRTRRTADSRRLGRRREQQKTPAMRSIARRGRLSRVGIARREQYLSSILAPRSFAIKYLIRSRGGMGSLGHRAWIPGPQSVAGMHTLLIPDPFENMSPRVPVHESRVTTVQNGIEPRADLEGASVDPTNGTSLGSNHYRRRVCALDGRISRGLNLVVLI
jgi:hypothetical protein